jgi:ELWxxDGT repeat protein
VRRVLGSGAALLLLVCPAVLAAPRRVADLYSGSGGLTLAPYPVDGVELGGVSYFPAADVQAGYELWRSDGTAPGTYRLTDICPGACDSGAAALGFFHGAIYMLANDGERGAGLWRTDGAPGHEVPVEGVCDAACITGLAASQRWRAAFWFLEPGPHKTLALWTSDLTAAGTHAVANLCGDLGFCGLAAASRVTLGGPDPSGQGLLLWVYTGADGDSLALYRTDGTAQGTVLLHHFAVASLTPSGPRPAVGGPLFFLDGDDLWESDGTPAGTHLVRSLAGLVSTDFPFAVQSQDFVDGVWYGIFDGGAWLRSDGTAGGTVVLATFLGAYDPTVTHVGSAVLAVTDDGVWRAGAAAAATVKVFSWQSSGVLGVVEQAERAFVLVWAGDQGGAVWATDGTAGGTLQVRLPAGEPVDQYQMGSLAGGVMISRGGDQVWGVDATATQVVELHDFQPANGPSLAAGGAVLDGRLLFYARSAPATTSLFASDGTTAGTAVLNAAANDPFDPSFPSPSEYLFSLFGGNKVLFANAAGLWVSDGSSRGTERLNRNAGLPFPIQYSPVATLGESLVFGGEIYGGPSCGPREDEPWITDGVPGHAREILDLNPYFYDGGGSQCDDLPLPSNPGPGISLGSTALFPADDLVHGRELFSTDGTAAGTRLVADINPQTVPNTATDPPGDPPRAGVGSNPSDFAALGSRALFVADDGTSGRQLWITNGTARGTRRVSRLLAGQDGSTPHDLVAWRGAVYFVARHGAGEGLFKSDGTAPGTVLVSDLELAGLSTRATQLTIAGGAGGAGGRLFFAGFNEATGTELWTSAGTAQTTGMVADLWPGARGSQPRNLTAVHGLLVFAADDGVSGLEVWRSDGTAGGTFQLGDIAPGEASSNPGPFWVVGERVVFGADDGEHGRELWTVPVAEVVGDAARDHER